MYIDDSRELTKVGFAHKYKSTWPSFLARHLIVLARSVSVVVSPKLEWQQQQ